MITSQVMTIHGTKSPKHKAPFELQVAARPRSFDSTQMATDARLLLMTLLLNDGLFQARSRAQIISSLAKRS